MNRPWPIISKILHSKYRIIAEIDFLACDNPQKMFHELSLVYKKEYRPDEKIIVYHYDTDYYIENTGFCLHNFLQCLKFLNISPSVILMITNHHGIEKEIKSFYQKNYIDIDYAVDHMTIFESNHSQWQTTPLPAEIDLCPHEIDFPFICLFGTKRTHRVVLFSILKKRDILDKGICAWNKDTAASDVPYPQQSTMDSNPVSQVDNVLTVARPPTLDFYMPEFLTTVPFTRVNENWPLNPEIRQNFQEFSHEFDRSYRHPLIVGQLNQNRFDQPSIQKTFLYVVTETVFQYPYPYLTEKTFRAIIHKRPFVILGATNSLKFLQQSGFKTFRDFWNEDYDDISDPNQRILEIVNIIEKITKMNVTEQRKLCYNMSDILTHNFNHYVNNYSKSDLFRRLETIR